MYVKFVNFSNMVTKVLYVQFGCLTLTSEVIKEGRAFLGKRKGITGRNTLSNNIIQ